MPASPVGYVQHEPLGRASSWRPASAAVGAGRTTSPPDSTTTTIRSATIGRPASAATRSGVETVGHRRAIQLRLRIRTSPWSRWLGGPEIDHDSGGAVDRHGRLLGGAETSAGASSSISPRQSPGPHQSHGLRGVMTSPFFGQPTSAGTRAEARGWGATSGSELRGLPGGTKIDGVRVGRGLFRLLPWFRASFLRLVFAGFSVIFWSAPVAPTDRRRGNTAAPARYRGGNAKRGREPEVLDEQPITSIPSRCPGRTRRDRAERGTTSIGVDALHYRRRRRPDRPCRSPGRRPRPMRSSSRACRHCEDRPCRCRSTRGRAPTPALAQAIAQTPAEGSREQGHDARARSGRCSSG